MECKRDCKWGMSNGEPQSRAWRWEEMEESGNGDDDSKKSWLDDTGWNTQAQPGLAQQTTYPCFFDGPWICFRLSSPIQLYNDAFGQQLHHKRRLSFEYLFKAT